jgi:hypothetical protein
LSRNVASQGNGVKAIIFDAYGILFDTHSVRDELESTFPGHGDYLTQIWRLKQLEYSWLRALTGDYKHFREVTRDALCYSLATLDITSHPKNWKGSFAPTTRCDCFRMPLSHSIASPFCGYQSFPTVAPRCSWCFSATRVSQAASRRLSASMRSELSSPVRMPTVLPPPG